MNNIKNLVNDNIQLLIGNADLMLSYLENIKNELNLNDIADIDTLETYNETRELFIETYELLINGIGDYCKDAFEEENFNKDDLKKETLNKKIFPFIEKNTNSYLTYSYYDVEIRGVNYQDIDLNNIKINHSISFKLEPDNKNDPNAIQVYYDELLIGYVPKNSLQDMIRKTFTNDDRSVKGYISYIDEDKKNIQMALGFYIELIDGELEEMPHRDAIINSKESKNKGAFNNIEVYDNLILKYNVDTETYYVYDNESNELGELSRWTSNSIKEDEFEGNTIYCVVNNIEKNNSNDIECELFIFTF